MQLEQLLKKVIQVLEDNQIDYMVTGSTVSSLQGAPRSTHDVDIVVIINYSAIKPLLNAFPFPDYYLSEDAIKEAIKYKNMFNLVDINASDKIDFWLFKDDDFDISRFSRKYEDDTLGFKVKVSAAEDTILAKLRWTKDSGGSERQFNDALRVYELQYGILDKTYLNEWVKKLNVEDLFDELNKQANPIL